MPRPRFHRLDPELQERILEVAAQEFSESGFDGASLNRVIERAGISKGAFYYYFDGKEDLFTTVLRMAWRIFGEREPVAIETLERETFWPALLEKVNDLMELARSREWLAGLARLVYHPPRSQRVRGVVQEEFSRVRELLGQIVSRGQTLGLVRHDLPEDLLLALVFATAEAADRWMVDHWEELPRDETDRLAVELFQLLQRLVAPVSEGASR